MTDKLHTVVETTAYLASAKGLLSDAERAEIIDMIAGDPTRGDLIAGGGGVRKMRFAIGHKGKSGGVRVIYLHYGDRLPIFLFVVYAKSRQDDLTDAQTSQVARAAKLIINAYGRRDDA